MIFLFVLCLLGFRASGAEPSTTPQVFRLHLVSEPVSLKPWEQKNSNGAYLLGQVFGTLLKYQDHELKPSIAEKCEFKKPLLLVCTLNPKASFSDDSPITAQDFEKSFKEFLKPQNQAFRADLLFPIKNAEAYFTGKAEISQVGIKAKDKFHLEFQLAKEDPEFVYNLTSHLLTPLKSLEIPSNASASQMITSGAYKILSWEPQKKIKLQHLRRPEVLVEFIFVTEDAVALNLYEKGELQFLRRLPTLYIPKFKDRPDFKEADQIRFDYIGFGPELKDFPEVRKALSESIDFQELNKILFTKGSFGCPGFLPVEQSSTCVHFNPELQNSKAQPKVWPKNLPHLKLSFSKLGGDDIKRTMEWIQTEWKKRLGLQVELEQVENKIFVEQLKTQPGPIFRKGLSPERPTCWASLSSFAEGAPEDYLKIREPEFVKLLTKLKKSIPKPVQYHKNCEETLKYLIDHHLLIPTGPIHFTLLAKPEWTGWSLNDLNQLDLSELKNKSTK